jgi:hypothetical protein
MTQFCESAMSLLAHSLTVVFTAIWNRDYIGALRQTALYIVRWLFVIVQTQSVPCVSVRKVALGGATFARRKALLPGLEGDELRHTGELHGVVQLR